MRDFTQNKNYPLYREQNEAIEFLLSKSRVINAMSTGFGKTYTTLSLVEYLRALDKEVRCIIICPSKAVKIFSKELREKLMSRYSLITASHLSFDITDNYFIFNYSSLKKYLEYLSLIRERYSKVVFILDEAHNLQNPRAQVYKLVRQAILGADRVILMTATPLLNDLEGLYWMVSLIYSRLFGSIQMFRDTYEEIKERLISRRGQSRVVNEVVGYKNLDHLRKVLEPYLFIRKKEYRIEFVYESVAAESVIMQEYSKVANGSKDKTGDSWGARLHDLQKVVDNTKPIVKLSNKEKLLLTLVRGIVRTGQNVLIYCAYYDVLDRLSYVFNRVKYYISVNSIYYVTGNVSVERRGAVEDNLYRSDVVFVTKAGTESVNLQKANNVIFYDIPFAINDVIQFIGRVARVDSKFDLIKVIFCESEGTIDSYKSALMKRHSVLIDDVICHDQNLPVFVLEEDLKELKLLRSKYLWRTRNGRH